MTDTATQEAPAKRTISPEQKAKMIAALAKGRATAAANRAARAAAPKPTFIQEGHRAVDPPVVRRSASTDPNADLEGADLEGLTLTDCPDACTPECCVITGRRRVNFENQGRDAHGIDIVTTRQEGWTTHCGHPAKGGIQAIHQMDQGIKARYARAKKHLAHLAVDRK